MHPSLCWMFVAGLAICWFAHSPICHSPFSTERAILRLRRTRKAGSWPL